MCAPASRRELAGCTSAAVPLRLGDEEAFGSQTCAVITRRTGYLTISDKDVPRASKQLQTDGFVVLRSVFDDDEVKTLAEDVERVYAQWPPDERSTAYPLEH